MTWSPGWEKHSLSTKTSFNISSVAKWTYLDGILTDFINQCFTVCLCYAHYRYCNILYLSCCIGSLLLTEGLFTLHCFELKIENFIFVLVVNLHDSSILGAWQCNLLKMGFKLHIFENNTIIIYRKLPKNKFVKMVVSNACVLHIHSIGMCMWVGA